MSKSTRGVLPGGFRQKILLEKGLEKLKKDPTYKTIIDTITLSDLTSTLSPHPNTFTMSPEDVYEKYVHQITHKHKTSPTELKDLFTTLKAFYESDKLYPEGNILQRYLLQKANQENNLVQFTLGEQNHNNNSNIEENNQQPENELLENELPEYTGHTMNMPLRGVSSRSKNHKSSGHLSIENVGISHLESLIKLYEKYCASYLQAIIVKSQKAGSPQRRSNTDFIEYCRDLPEIVEGIKVSQAVLKQIKNLKNTSHQHANY